MTRAAARSCSRCGTAPRCRPSNGNRPRGSSRGCCGPPVSASVGRAVASPPRWTAPVRKVLTRSAFGCSGVPLPRRGEAGTSRAAPPSPRTARAGEASPTSSTIGWRRSPQRAASTPPSSSPRQSPTRSAISSCPTPTDEAASCKRVSAPETGRTQAGGGSRSHPRRRGGWRAGCARPLVHQTPPGIVQRHGRSTLSGVGRVPLELSFRS
jgi:hypothetical protein